MKIRTISILSIVLIGLVVSGCTGPTEETSVSQTPSSTPAATSTSTPNYTGDVMDSEISTIQSDMNELESLFEDIESIQDMNFSELEDLDF